MSYFNGGIDLSAGNIYNNLLQVTTVNEAVNGSGVTIAGTLSKNGYMQVNDVSAPANPANGQGRIYKKIGSAGLFWLPDSTGGEVNLVASATSVARVGTTADSTIPRWSGANVNTIQGSGVSIDINNNISGVASLALASGGFNTTLTVSTQSVAAPSVNIPNLTGVGGDLLINNATQNVMNKSVTNSAWVGGSVTALNGFSITDNTTNKLAITTASGLTLDRTLTVNVNDANRSINLNGNVAFGGVVSLASNFTTSGANPLTLVTAGTTSLTLPTSGTLVTTTAGQSLTNKTLTSPIINDATIDIHDTGSPSNLQLISASSPVLTLTRSLTMNVNNASRTINLNGNITLGSDLTTVGSNSLTFTTTGPTNITLPTSGTIVTAPINLASQVTGTLAIANGGTNSLAAVSGSSIMVSNGTSIVQGALGTTTTVLHGNAAGVPTYGAVSLATDVSGTLGVALGGTGQSTYTDGQLLIGNTATSSLSKASLTGVANQIIVTPGNGSITLSTPQSIGVASTPTFGSVSLSAVANQLVLGTTTTATVTASAPAASRIYTIADPGANSSFVMDQGAQTIAGSKTFASTITGSISGTASNVTGTVVVAKGGTNSIVPMSGSSVMITDGTSIVQGAAGTSTTVLHGNAAGAPTYGAVSLTNDVSGVLTVINGGTSSTGFTPYSILLGNNTGGFGQLGPVVNSLAGWNGSAVAASITTLPSNIQANITQLGTIASVATPIGVAFGGTNSIVPMSGSSLMVSNGTSIVQGAAGTTTTVLHGNAAGVPTYSAVSLATDVSGILPIVKGGTNSTTAMSGSSIMVTDGTSIVQGPVGSTTLVLHGNAAGAPTYGSVNLTTDVSGLLSVVKGGTNSAAVLNNNRIMVSIAGVIQEAAALTNGQFLIGSTGAAPVAASLTAGANITLTPSAGGLQIDSTSSGTTMLYRTIASKTGVCNNYAGQVSMISGTTGVGSLTLAANSLAVGDVISWKISGTMSTGFPTSNNGSIYVYLGAIQVGGAGGYTPSIQTNTTWYAEGDVVIRTIGATGTSTGTTAHYIQDQSATLNANYVGIVAATVDTTTSKVFDIQYSMSLANTTNTITINKVVLKKN